MSEYGDKDGSGMTLAQTITEDVAYLRPAAWIYWQPLEPFSAWGLVNGAYDESATQANRGEPKWVYYKYYVMAQFTRFVRPGDKLIGSGDHNTIAAYSAKDKRMSFVTVNYGTAQRITYDLSGVSQVGSNALVTVTNTDGSRLFETSVANLEGKKLSLNAEANSIYSIDIEQVVL